MAGLTSGNVITKLNGKEISNALDLRNELYKLNRGDEVEVVYFNGESECTAKVTLTKK